MRQDESGASWNLLGTSCDRPGIASERLGIAKDRTGIQGTSCIIGQIPNFFIELGPPCCSLKWSYLPNKVVQIVRMCIFCRTTGTTFLDNRNHHFGQLKPPGHTNESNGWWNLLMSGGKCKESIIKNQELCVKSQESRVKNQESRVKS